MFPIKDNIPARHFPMVNVWLIIVNVLCFLYQLQLGPRVGRLMLEYGFVPARFMAMQQHDFFDLSRFAPVLSCMFLHGGLMHLLSNMWMLWVFGDNVEDSMGHLRYLAFYLLCGSVSVFAQAWAAPYSELPLVGASGAISGVLGAYFLSYPRARILTMVPLFVFFYLVEIPAFFFLGFWFLLQFVQGYVQLVAVGPSGQGGVAWWAHVGGFGAGLALVYFLRDASRRRPRRFRFPRPWGWQ